MPGIYFARNPFFLAVTLAVGLAIPVSAQDARNVPTAAPPVAKDPQLLEYGLFAATAPRPSAVPPRETTLPLTFQPGERIALIGNTLWERAQEDGQGEALLHQRFPRHRLVVRNLSWSADEVALRPRPANFADLDQHLYREKIDVVLAAYGFNESFAGEAGKATFRQNLLTLVQHLRTHAYNGRQAPRVVLVSPIANENTSAVAAADRNNRQIQAYAAVMGEVAAAQRVGFVEVFKRTEEAMRSPGSDLTLNGCHLNAAGYTVFSQALYQGLFGEPPPAVSEPLRLAIVDRDRQYFRRYRPLNTFYYTGDRNKEYGYLDFLPALRNFDQLVANRDERIWALAAGETPPPAAKGDTNLLPLPPVDMKRGANEWLSAAEELQAFQVDARFEVNLFAGEEQFPDAAKPIQIRWDSAGRLWVSTSTTYPHVYPGAEPNDKLVVLEDTDQDGRADKSTVFADKLHIPLSFEFGDGGVYVSEQPNLTFLRDTDGDGRADLRRTVLSGFGTEDSHHALHDFVWTPDGDLIFRESIFHHSQVETPYGPVRQQNSGWFRFQPRTQYLHSFGSYPSTNPWGVTFDDWGRHVASHPIFAAAFHALDPPYPQQHPAPTGLQAYSGTCGQEFIDFATFPPELQGCFVKVRYKPTNRVELHRWAEGDFGFEEEYLGDLIFSTNLSFIPVDIQFGPRGDLFICDWYNPVKGHAQYSLRDERRDRRSGRIWRITARGRPLQTAPRIAGAPLAELLDLLQRPEYRIRYWAKRELREREPADVRQALDQWVARLSPADPRYRHHQVEALWTYRTIGTVQTELLRELLVCENHHARAAATQQLRYWHQELPDAASQLRRAIHDPSGLVRMEAVIAASYVGTPEALSAALEVFQHPHAGHLSYAITCALGSHTLRRHWEADALSPVPRLLQQLRRTNDIKEPRPTGEQARFDRQDQVKQVAISCLPERMLFTVRQFTVAPSQPVKLVFTNPDATDHNLVLVRPGALAEVGMAANAMAKNPKFANSDFIPQEKQSLILQATPLIGPTRKSQIHVLRFVAPTEPGVYPYVCTFPGHWVVMNGQMVVARNAEEAASLVAAQQPAIVRPWKLADFPEVPERQPGPVADGHPEEAMVARGMQAFVKARCNQCHAVGGHGINLGPDLSESLKKFRGRKLLRQVLEPSHEIHEKFQTTQLVLADGRVVTGVILREDSEECQVVANLLTPETVTRVGKDLIAERIVSRLSPMPEGLVDVLTKAEILELLTFLEHPPAHSAHQHP